MSTARERRALARLVPSTRALPQAGWEPRFLTSVLLTLLVAAALALPAVAQDEPRAGEASTIGGVSTYVDPTRASGRWPRSWMRERDGLTWQ